MIPRQVALPVFICVALLQLAVPLSMISRREVTLRHGRQYRFKTAPVDPYDAFRGRFVALGMENNSGPPAAGAQFSRGQKAYALIEEDGEGFARIAEVSPTRPREGGYITARVRYASGDTVHLGLPFDRYYMNERRAPQAERAYRDHSRRGNRDAYVAVRVRSGFAVLEELYVAGKPILEFLEE